MTKFRCHLNEYTPGHPSRMLRDAIIGHKPRGSDVVSIVYFEDTEDLECAQSALVFV